MSSAVSISAPMLTADNAPVGHLTLPRAGSRVGRQPASLPSRVQAIPHVARRTHGPVIRALTVKGSL